MGIEYSGTVDGAPAKVVYYPERKQTQIYWGGMGRPDGLFHNHMTIQDANPDAVHFLRVNGRIVVDMSRTSHEEAQRLRVATSIADILRDSWRRALRWWGM